MSLEGVWTSRGYGWRLEIDAAGYAFFDVTPGDCVEFERGGREEFSAGVEASVDEGDDTLRLNVRNELSVYEFKRARGPSPACLSLDAPRDGDALRNFAFFRQAFSQDYAFFENRGVDWDALCEEASASISATTTPDALFSTLAELIQPLKDNHVSLTNGDTTARSERIGETKALLRRTLGMKIDHVGHPDNLALLGRFIHEQYLDGAGKSAGNGAVHWGMIAPRVGYLNVMRLFGLHDAPSARRATDLPPRRPEHAAFLQRDLEAVDDILDAVLEDFAQAKAVILDIRLNGGGFDKVALAIADRFADTRRLAFSKEARDGAGLTPRQEFHVEPRRRSRFSGPVYVLTANRTSSAGDILALSMRALPHALLLGQPSTGILSDNLAKHMPNGWRFYLSNEFYRSPEGEVFEGCGVPVDIETPVFQASDFASGFRLAVDAALRRIETQTAPLPPATAAN